MSERTRLGLCSDGRDLFYDRRKYLFFLGRDVATYAEVKGIEDAGKISWRALEQRDWFNRIDPAELATCAERALTEGNLEGLTPEERVQADAARDDSVLAGKIVDADPVLVQAVADRLVQEGYLSAGDASDGERNELAEMDLPKGMEALSQMERHEGSNRKATPAEKCLMRKILKNNEKEKVRREREEEAAEKRGEEPSGDGDGPSSGDEEKDSARAGGPSGKREARRGKRDRTEPEPARQQAETPEYSGESLTDQMRSLGLNPDGSPKRRFHRAGSDLADLSRGHP
jgi:hypothetical protein